MTQQLFNKTTTEEFPIMPRFQFMSTRGSYTNSYQVIESTRSQCRYPRKRNGKNSTSLKAVKFKCWPAYMQWTQYDRIQMIPVL